MKKATNYFYESAKQNFAPSAGNLIIMYSSGQINDPAILEDTITIMKNMAEGGNLDALRRVGNLYYDGVGVKRDYAEALKWYEKCANLGDAWCRMRCGEMYRDGKGTDIDNSRASEYFLM